MQNGEGEERWLGLRDQQGDEFVFVSNSKSKLLSLGRSRGKSRHETKSAASETPLRYLSNSVPDRPMHGIPRWNGPGSVV